MKVTTMTGRNQNDDDNYRNSDVNNKNNPE